MLMIHQSFRRLNLLLNYLPLQTDMLQKLLRMRLAHAAMLLGAGRETKESKIDLAAGLMLRKKIGDKVNKGESLVTIYSNFENVEKVKEKLYKNIKISDAKVPAPNLIYEQITE